MQNPDSASAHQISVASPTGPSFYFFCFVLSHSLFTCMQTNSTGVSFSKLMPLRRHPLARIVHHMWLSADRDAAEAGVLKRIIKEAQSLREMQRSETMPSSYLCPPVGVNMI